MNSPYVQDNTRSLVIVIASMVGACVLIAALLGLSDKPVIDSVVVARGAIAASNDGTQTTGSGSTGDNTGTESEDVENDPAGVSFTDLTAEEVPGFDDSEAAEGQSGVVAAPTAEPTPTTEPEIAPAVETVVVADDTSGASTDDASTSDNEAGADVTSDLAQTPLTSGASPSGSAVGNFFTRPDEENGAIVRENTIQVSFDGDGGGTFTGMLDMTYSDGATVSINMIGAFIWTAGSPQVKTDIAGTYVFDSTDDTKDVTEDRAELSITSLESGSGALCTPTCYGFTFPPQSIS